MKLLAWIALAAAVASGQTASTLKDAYQGIFRIGAALNPAQFEMEFHYPATWTLVATGKQILRVGGEDGQRSDEAGAEKASRWSSERPIPVAGFNLGKYVRAEAKAGIRVSGPKPGGDGLTRQEAVQGKLLTPRPATGGKWKD